MPLDGEISDYYGWTARNEHWLKQSQSDTKARGKRIRNAEPLILSGHGVHLRIDRDTLHIRNGFTHYPQDQEIYRYFRGDLNLPTRIIMLDGSGGISFDVLRWLSQQGVVLVQLDWRGEVLNVIGGFGYAGDPAKVEWQNATRADPQKRVAFSTDLIRQKIEASIIALQTAFPVSATLDRAVAKLSADARELQERPPQDITALRGIEGRAAYAYFKAWHGSQLNWKLLAKRPVPDDWKTIGSRSAVRVGKIMKNERATHPLNAMLNYGYAVLQSQLQIKAVAAGYDPSLGIMHHGYQGSPAYIFDLMEPERPKVDAAILMFALSETFTGADFLITADGSCRLAPQLARRVIGLCRP